MKTTAEQRRYTVPDGIHLFTMAAPQTKYTGKNATE